MSDLLKKTSDSLIRSYLVSNSLTLAHFGERFAHSHVFLVSDLTKAHIALYKRGSEWIARFLKLTKIIFYLNIFEWITYFLWAKEQFTQKKQVALLSWVTWVICSRSLIFGEWPEKIAHGWSFLVSDLSNLLTVTLLSWVIWANCF